MKTLAICDTNKEYMLRLKKRLDLKGGFPFEVITYDNLDIFFKRINQKMPDIALIEEKLICDYFHLADFTAKEKIILIALTEDELMKNTENEEVPEIPCINRYQSAESIKNQMLQMVSDKICDYSGKKSLPHGKNTEILGFYSPVKRVMQTEVALTMGHVLKDDGRCLYLDFDAFPQDIENDEGYEEVTKNIADLVFAASNNTGNLILKLESMKKDYMGTDYVCGVSDYRDITESEIQDWIELINRLEEIKIYDYILLNISDNLPGFMNILKKCSKIYTIFDNNKKSQKTIKQYQENLQSENMKEVYSKSKFIVIPENFCRINKQGSTADLERFVHGLL